MRQMTFADIVPELQPQWTDCFKTCKNFSNDLPGGGKDYFMDWGRGVPDKRYPRCVIGMHAKMKSKLIDNLWHTWCPHYEPK